MKEISGSRLELLAVLIVNPCGVVADSKGGVRWTPMVRQPEPLLKV